MHCVLVGILSATHVLEKRLEQIREPPRVGVEEEWERWEYHIDGLAIAIAANLLQEQQRIVRRAAEGCGAHDLSCAELDNLLVIVAATCVCIFGYLCRVVRCECECVLVVVIVEGDHVFVRIKV